MATEVGHSSVFDDSDTDEDSIVFVRRRSHSQRPTWHNDSDEEEEDCGELDANKLVSVLGHRSQICSGSESDSGNERTPVQMTKRKSRIIRTSLSSDSEAQGSAATPVARTKRSKVKRRNAKSAGVGSTLADDAVRSPVLSGGVGTTKYEEALLLTEPEKDAKQLEYEDVDEMNDQRAKTFLANNDLFDAENSDDSGTGSKEDSCSLNAIKKSVKKKVGKSEKPQRLSKDGLKQLHSESQRIVRESRVSLPYHMPQQKSLDEFLKRRKSTPLSLKPSSGEITSLLKADLISRNAAANDAAKVLILPKTLISDQPNTYPPNNPSLDLQLASHSLASGPGIDGISSLSGPGISGISSLTSILPLNDVMDHTGLGRLPPVDDELPDLEMITAASLALESAASHGDFAICMRDHDIPEALKGHQTSADDANTPIEPDRSKIEIVAAKTVQCVSTVVNCQTPLSQERRLLAKLQISRDLTPRLGGAPNSVISLEKIDHGGINDLIRRYKSHSSTKNNQKPKQVVEINVLKLERTSQGDERLINKKVQVTLGQDEAGIPKDMQPGERRRLFTESLKTQLQRQRSEARIRRSLQKAEDNEEGSEDENKPEKEEEEEEEILSDVSDSDMEDEEVESESEIGNVPERKRRKNAFIDDEAEESDDECVGMDVNSADEDSVGDVLKRAGANASPDIESAGSPLPLRLRLHLDEESSPPLNQASTNIASIPGTVNLSRADTVQLLASADSFQLDSPAKILPPDANSSFSSVEDRSFELVGSLVPCYQPQRKRRRQPCPVIEEAEDDDGNFLSPSVQVGIPMDAAATQPINADASIDTTDDNSSEPAMFGCSRFWGLDSHRISSTAMNTLAPIMKQRLGLGNNQMSQSQTNTDELFELCSGKWSDSVPVSRDTSGQITSGISALGDLNSPMSTQVNMDQLLGLCSGSFSGLSALSSAQTERPFSSLSIASSEIGIVDRRKCKTNTKNKRLESDSRLFFDDELSCSSTNSAELVVRRGKSKRVISDSEGEENTNDYFSGSGEEEERDVYTKKKHAIQDFFEGEAELSGSDVPSDEDDDLDEEDDILEEELGDQDVMSEDELKEQVGKVHHKMLLDDDQKQLRLYKEMYLEHGDLHGETNGRSRKFRWKTIDVQEDERPRRNSDSSDVEDETNDEEEQMKIRLKRHEREKWLCEPKKMQKESSEDEDENFISTGHKIHVLSRRNSSQILREKLKSAGADKNTKPKLKPLVLRGSFLAKGKQVLAKIADMTKNTSDAGKKTGPRNTRNFVFSVLSPSKEPRPASPVPPASSTPSSAIRIAKKPRLEKRSLLPANGVSNVKSIFHLF